MTMQRTAPQHVSLTAEDSAVALWLTQQRLVMAAVVETARHESRDVDAFRRRVLDAVDPTVLRRVLDQPVDSTGAGGGGLERLGDWLVRTGWLEATRLDDFRTSQKVDGAYLGFLLVDRGVITREQRMAAEQHATAEGIDLWRALVQMGLSQFSDLYRLATRPLSGEHVEREENAVLERLVSRGLITQKAAETARRAAPPGAAPSEVLVDTDQVAGADLAEAVAEVYALGRIDLDAEPPDPTVARLIPAELAHATEALAVSRHGDTVVVAVSHPIRNSMLTGLGGLLGVGFEFRICVKSTLRAALEAIFGPAPQRTFGLLDEPLSELLAEDPSAEQLVEGLLDEAVARKISDVHIDPATGGLRVRFRLDGWLQDVLTIPAARAPSVLQRIKILAGINIVARGQTQDGHIRGGRWGRAVDFRVCASPVLGGEKICLRLLDEQRVSANLAQLGLEPTQLLALERMVHQPHGMIVACGPVGAGKTTSLYAAVNWVNTLARNVMTIEDPVEYRMSGVNHMSVESGSMDFAAGLRAILRQDPDVVMVGEIRDPDTAQTAMRAALTGILVFTSIHAADCTQLPDVLAQYDIDRRIISAGLIGAVAQRLVRRICPACKQPFKPDARMLSVLDISEAQLTDGVLYRGIGCSQCLHTGYKGRTGIFEVLEFDTTLREMIFSGLDRASLRQVALASGAQPLRTSGLHRVLDGTTTVEEFLRAVGMPE